MHTRSNDAGRPVRRDLTSEERTYVGLLQGDDHQGAVGPL
jgi:hypothetical protein